MAPSDKRDPQHVQRSRAAIDLTLSSPEPEQRPRDAQQQRRRPGEVTATGRSNFRDCARTGREHGTRTPSHDSQPRTRLIKLEDLARIIDTSNSAAIKGVLLDLCKLSPALSGAVARGLAAHSTYAQDLIGTYRSTSRASASTFTRAERNDDRTALERMRSRMKASPGSRRSSLNHAQSSSSSLTARAQRSGESRSTSRFKRASPVEVEDSESDLDQHVPEDFSMGGQQRAARRSSLTRARLPPSSSGTHDARHDDSLSLPRVKRERPVLVKELESDSDLDQHNPQNFFSSDQVQAAQNSSLTGGRPSFPASSHSVARSGQPLSVPRIKRERPVHVEDSDSDQDQYIPKDFPLSGNLTTPKRKSSSGAFNSRMDNLSPGSFSLVERFAHVQNSMLRKPKKKTCIQCQELLDEGDEDLICFYHSGSKVRVNGTTICQDCNRPWAERTCSFGSHVTVSGNDIESLKRHSSNRSQSPSKKSRRI